MKKVEPLRFSLTLATRKILLMDEGGVETEFELRQMDGRSRDAYMDENKGNMIINPEGKVIGLKTFKGLNSSLLKYCFHDGKGVLVSEERIQALPSLTLAKLFEVAQKMNGLEPPEKKEKND